MLIVGLGNPGKKYENNRHNIGFMVIDHLCKKHNIVLNKNKFNGVFCKIKLFNQDVIIAKPETFMNKSGEFVKPLSKFFNIDPEKIVVLVDDKDMDFGKLKIRNKGSSGGQNGIKNIINQLGIDNFIRFKIGIGKPDGDTAQYVLSDFPKKDSDKLNKIIESVSLAVESIIKEDYLTVSNKYSNSTFE